MTDHLPHRLSKRQTLTTVLLRTPVTQMIFFNQGTISFGEQRDQNESGKLAYSMAFISGLIDCDRFRNVDLG